jgi:probable F420-dependent oxidoreductase
MRVNTEMPLEGGCAEPAAISRLAAALERSGFAGLGFTDHPAPSRKWLTSGGHPTYDPFAALAFCAATTSTIRLLTYLAVLPYRSPMMTAKSIATVDRLSGGRLTVAVGSGYLRSEFLALGRSFEDRNDLVDEALAVLDGVYDPNGFSFEGADFTARDQIIEPGPVQRPRPPIWIGGGSRRSRERAARCGDGWAPLLAEAAFAKVTRTAALATVDELAVAITELRAMTEAEGRDPKAMAVQIDGLVAIPSALEAPEQHHDLLGRLESIGVSDVLARIPRGSAPTEAIDLVEAYGATFLEPSVLTSRGTPDEA